MERRLAANLEDMQQKMLYQNRQAQERLKPWTEPSPPPSPPPPPPPSPPPDDDLDPAGAGAGAYP